MGAMIIHYESILFHLLMDFREKMFNILFCKLLRLNLPMNYLHIRDRNQNVDFLHISQFRMRKSTHTTHTIRFIIHQSLTRYFPEVYLIHKYNFILIQLVKLLHEQVSIVDVGR